MKKLNGYRAAIDKASRDILVSKREWATRPQQITETEGKICYNGFKIKAIIPRKTIIELESLVRVGRLSRTNTRYLILQMLCNDLNNFMHRHHLRDFKDIFQDWPALPIEHWANENHTLSALKAYIDFNENTYVHAVCVDVELECMMPISELMSQYDQALVMTKMS